MPKVSKDIIMESEDGCHTQQKQLHGWEKKGSLQMEGSNHFPDSRGNERMVANKRCFTVIASWFEPILTQLQEVSH
jgi:hypothetical protein